VQFGISAFRAADRDEWQGIARQAESWGFDTLWVADHVGMFDPFVATMSAADATERLRVGTYVLNAEFWNPLLLARAAATAHLLTGERFVLGLGAGHARVEFEQAGLRYPPAADRVERLELLVPVLRRLLAGETVTERALHLVHACTGLAPGRTPVPLLIGGNGNRVLRLAGTGADIAGVVGFTSGTGQIHTDLSHWSWDGLADRIARVRGAAGDRPPAIDLLVQHVAVTDDREGAVRDYLRGRDTDLARHLESPFLLLGTEEEITDQLRRLATAGVDRVTVFAPAAEPLAPVIERLRS
jgi:probable F420-dependent oxidoreductase